MGSTWCNSHITHSIIAVQIIDCMPRLRVLCSFVPRPSRASPCSLIPKPSRAPPSFRGGGGGGEAHVRVWERD